MSLDVSSWFVEQSRRPDTAPKRVFFIGGSDYSAQVQAWPKLKFKADTIDLGTASVSLSNRDRNLLFFAENGVSMTTSCEVSLAYTHPYSGEERVSLYVGEPSAVSFGDGGLSAKLQLQGKTKRLTDVALGSDTESGGLDFTGSEFYPSDLAWTLVACHGGLSAVADSSNPDIDFAKWRAWNNLNIIRDVRVQGFFTGEKIYQVLNTLAFMDSMVILFRNSKLDFTPIIDGYGSSSYPIFPDHIIDMKLSIDPGAVTNEYSVEADYDLASSKFKVRYFQVNSQSRINYGKRSGRFGSQSVWFSSLEDARYLAEDILRFHQHPLARVSLSCPLAGGVHLTVGDVVTITDSVFQLQQIFRITETGIDLGRGRIELKCDQANQRPWHYQATVSSVNLQVRTITPCGDGNFYAVDETFNGSQVYRTNEGGSFLPLGVFATAVVPVSGEEVLFGGPPASGSPHSVIQRSSDRGSTTATVSSLSPFLSNVHEIYGVDSTTFLAATNSGGIWRSTDAGTSWNLTMTISPAYHVSRFFRPWPNVLWATTGFDIPADTAGAHIWQSDDEGATWSPKHTAVESGTFNIQGLYRIDDTAFLLSTTGASVNDIAVYRSKFTSADSISWVRMLSQAGFSEIVRTDSGHLLFGFQENVTLNGGTTYRSLDQGSSWFADARIAKKGNARLIANEDGTVDAFTARILTGLRTDRHRNFDPNRID